MFHVSQALLQIPPGPSCTTVQWKMNVSMRPVSTRSCAPFFRTARTYETLRTTPRGHTTYLVPTKRASTGMPPFLPSFRAPSPPEISRVSEPLYPRGAPRASKPLSPWDIRKLLSLFNPRQLRKLPALLTLGKSSKADPYSRPEQNAKNTVVRDGITFSFQRIS